MTRDDRPDLTRTRLILGCILIGLAWLIAAGVTIFFAAITPDAAHSNDIGDVAVGASICAALCTFAVWWAILP